MNNSLILKLVMFFSLILLLLSCDVLTKINESEWNEENDKEEREDMFYIYVSGSCMEGTDDDFFIIKYDENGVDHWMRRLNILNNDQAFGLALDDSGNIYQGGYSDNGNNFFIIKYYYNGAILNSYSQVGGRYNGIICDHSNNVYAVGTDGLVSNIHKFDSTLNTPILNQTFNPGLSINRANKIAYNNNNIYVVGDSDIDVSSDLDFSIVNYDAGNFIQVGVNYYPAGTETNSHCARDIAIDNYGNIYIIGYVDMGGGYFDCILLKYNSSLNFIWERIININNDDRGEGIDIDSAGNVYLALHSGTGPGNFDCYTIKIDQLGNEMWRRQYGTNSVDDQLWDIAVDPKGNLYSVGNTGNELLVIKYDFYGYQIWTRLFTNTGFAAQARAVVVGNR